MWRIDEWKMKAARWTGWTAALCAAGLFGALFLAHETYADGTEATDITLDETDLQINQSGNPEPSDNFQIEVTFTNTEASDSGICETGDNPIANGLTITLGTGSDCTSTKQVVMVMVPALPNGGEDLRGVRTGTHRHPRLRRFLHAKIASETGSGPIDPASATIQGEIEQLPTPAGTCGQWKLEADIGHVDLSSITTNPVEVTLGVGDDMGCAAVTAEIQSEQGEDNDDQGDDNDDQGDNGNSQVR